MERVQPCQLQHPLFRVQVVHVHDRVHGGLLRDCRDDANLHAFLHTRCLHGLLVERRRHGLQRVQPRPLRDGGARDCRDVRGRVRRRLLLPGCKHVSDAGCVPRRGLLPRGRGRPDALQRRHIQSPNAAVGGDCVPELRRGLFLLGGQPVADTEHVPGRRLLPLGLGLADPVRRGHVRGPLDASKRDCVHSMRGWDVLRRGQLFADTVPGR